jgi:uncharacterized protein
VTFEVSIASARKQLAELVNKAAYGEQRLVLTRHGRPIAAIVSIADLDRLEHTTEMRTNIESALRIGRDVLTEICARHHVRELSIFGSALRQDFGPESDIDLLVEFQPNAKVGFIELGRLEAELVRLFGRRVDLVPKAGLRPILREEVLSTARVIYAA